MRPKLVAFGHIHGGRGEERAVLDAVQAHYENVLMGDSPWINLLMLIVHWVWEASIKLFMKRKHSQYTHFVNAAVVGKLSTLEEQGAISIRL